MKTRQRELRLYGALSHREPLERSWVEQQLSEAGTYWVTARADGHPHPRPVWGVWAEQRLYLSIGSPVLARAIGEQALVTIHLDSGTDVVIVEGRAAPSVPSPRPVVEAYNRKYDWDYQVDEYGQLTRVDPSKVMAWRSAGWAGRDGFSATGCWVFDRPG